MGDRKNCRKLWRLLNKVADYQNDDKKEALATSLKKRDWHRCFPVNFTKFLKTPFLQDTSRRLLLSISTLPFLIKVIEKLFDKMTNNLLDENKVLHKYQSQIPENHSNDMKRYWKNLITTFQLKWYWRTCRSCLTLQNIIFSEITAKFCSLLGEIEINSPKFA